jgi:hypothetical protein
VSMPRAVSALIERAILEYAERRGEAPGLPPEEWRVR